MTQTINDLMHKGLLTCPPETSLGKVAAMLTGHHVHALVVAEESEQPLGIISDFDLLAGEWLSVAVVSLDVQFRAIDGCGAVRHAESFQAFQVKPDMDFIRPFSGLWLDRQSAQARVTFHVDDCGVTLLIHRELSAPAP